MRTNGIPHEPHQVACVTSFSDDGYELYGRKFIQGWQRCWPGGVLYVYHEGVLDSLDEQSKYNPNVVFRNLFTEVTECQLFMDRHSDDLCAQGTAPPPGFEAEWAKKGAVGGYNFKFDAYKFCRKVFALDHASAWMPGTIKLMFWLDGDIRFLKPIPMTFVDSLMPRDAEICGLDRPGYYTECGFVGYRLPDCDDFLSRFAGEYSDDTVFSIREWHDSYVFDVVRKQMGMSFHDIGGPKKGGKVFDLSPLGEYMTHLKGNLKYEDGS